MVRLDPIFHVALAAYCAHTSTLIMPFVWLVSVICCVDCRLAAAYAQLLRLIGLNVQPFCWVIRHTAHCCCRNLQPVCRLCRRPWIPAWVVGLDGGCCDNAVLR